ncbi:MAG TPA: GerMN domain-containing protein [Spirochaetia bacterium]|nr:GerMN domain-containing protein [Spirochaetia bacterium]
MAAERSSRSRTRSSRGSSRRNPAPARHRGLGILFWLCLAAVVVAVAVAAREPLKAAFGQLAGKPAAGAAQTPPAGAPASSPAATAARGPGRGQPQVTVAPLTDRERAEARAAAGTPATGSDHGAAAASASSPTAASAGTAEHAAASVPEHPSVRKARLYFASVDPSGKLYLKSVIRTIPASDSPLTDTLQSLLKGPTAQELNLGLLSLIPVDAKLRSAAVKGDTAILDFSESFRFNEQGLDAMNTELRQIVYAATEFPSVKKVQIQIEGATVRYLGTEGIRLDAPLTRDSFQ